MFARGGPGKKILMSCLQMKIPEPEDCENLLIHPMDLDHLRLDWPIFEEFQLHLGPYDWPASISRAVPTGTDW